MPKKEKEAVRITSFEVAKIDGDWKTVTSRWHEVADTVKQATNFIWRRWLVFHTMNESPKKIREYLSLPKDKRPKPSVYCFPEGFSLTDIYHAVSDEFPQLAAITVTTLVKSVTEKIKNRKAANGNLPGWMAILLDNEGMPNTSKAQPIPFYQGPSSSNAKLMPPEGAGNFKIEFRISRRDVPGKKIGKNDVDLVEIRTVGRKLNSKAATLWKIIKGEYRLAGSALIYRKSVRKWFAQIAYKAPQEKQGALDENRTAFLVAGRNKPWYLRIDGKKYMLAGHGDHIAGIRRGVFTQRRQRQSTYRYAGSSVKGHGCKRAIKKLDVLSNRWKDFVKTSNHDITQRVVKKCLELNCGRVVYFQPTGEKAKKRFLATAGKTGWDSSAWDWFQVGTMLNYKGQDAGIKVDIRSERSGATGTTGAARKA